MLGWMVAGQWFCALACIGICVLVDLSGGRVSPWTAGFTGLAIGVSIMGTQSWLSFRRFNR